MLEKQYNEYLKLIKKITKDDSNAQDLLHDILIRFESNDKWNELTNKEKIFFLYRTIQNQFYSNNSEFKRTYKKYKFEEMGTTEQIETIYDEQPTLDWIYETLDKELKERPESWYQVGLFKMYLEFKKISIINKKTKIPKYSIRITIKEMKLWLQNKWETYKNE